MPAITFPTSSDPGVRPQESGGRLINAFVEKSEAGAPGAGLWIRSAGFRLVTKRTVAGHTRGFLDYGRVGAAANPEGAELPPAQIFWAVDGKLAIIKDDFNRGYKFTELGDLPGDRPVFFARNNAVTPHAFALVAEIIPGPLEGVTYKLGTGSSPVVFSTTDGAGDTPLHGATSMCDFGPYIVWSYRDGKVVASDLNSLTVNPLSFNTEQGQEVLRVCKFSNRLFAFGNKWTGVYRDAGTVPFPFLREATIPRGILGPHTLAGWETGWSNELIWVGSDCVVYKLNGLNAVPISNDAVSRYIASVVRKIGNIANPIDYLHCFVYSYHKNPFWVITSSYPDDSSKWTWEYNLSTGMWNERKSEGMNCWRGHQSVFAPQNIWLVGDLINGSLYKMEDDFYWDDEFKTTWTIESGIISGFPARVVIPRASFNIAASSAGTVAISWSLDGGANWGTPVTRNIGNVLNAVPGKDAWFHPEIICSGLSRGYGIRYRLEVDNSEWVGLSGGQIDTQPRAA